MAGSGVPERRPIEGAAGLDVVVVAGTWHTVITDGLIAGAQRVLDASGARSRLVRVPGSFELPVVSKAALEAGPMPSSPWVSSSAVARRTSSTSRLPQPTGSRGSLSTPESPSVSACSLSTPSSRDSTARGSRTRTRTRAPRPPMLRCGQRSSCENCAADQARAERSSRSREFLFSIV